MKYPGKSRKTNSAPQIGQEMSFNFMKDKVIDTLWLVSLHSQTEVKSLVEHFVSKNTLLISFLPGGYF